ncbi:MAG: HK97 family phage prohead protease [Reyranellaceae bacterium]
MFDNSKGTFNREMPLQTRLAPVVATTAKDETRTIDVIFSTGAKVARRDFWSGKRYDEELEISERAVDLSRLNGGAPLLNTHGTWTLEDQIGVVERAWIDGDKGMATVRFSPRDSVEPIWRDVKAGIVRNISIGYTTQRYEITEQEGKPPLYRAVEWQPYEISLVPVPADAGAGTRSASPSPLFPCHFVRAGQPVIDTGAAQRQRQIEILRLSV